MSHRHAEAGGAPSKNIAIDLAVFCEGLNCLQTMRRTSKHIFVQGDLRKSETREIGRDYPVTTGEAWNEFAEHER